MPSKPIKSNNQLSKAAQEHHEQIKAWEAKADAKLAWPCPFEIFTPSQHRDWLRSIAYASWVCHESVEQYRERIRAKYGLPNERAG